MRNVPQGEVAFRPFNSWNFQALPTLLVAVWGYITEAPLFHAMMWTVTAAGLASFFTLRRKAGEARWLAVVCATAWLGYNAFLLIVYLGAFSSYEAETAADYWRYTPHVALLALYVPVMALATGRWPTWMSRRGVVPALAAVVAALCALPARGDLNNPGDRADGWKDRHFWPRLVRDAATDMRRAMPPGSKVAVVSCWNGSPFGVMVRYYLWQLGVPEREIYATVLQDTEDGPDPTVVLNLATRGEVNYLVIQDAECEWDEDDTDKLGLSRIDHEVALFAWRNSAWEKVKSWPIPPTFLHRDR
jgi:hypothetical protein